VGGCSNPNEPYPYIVQLSLSTYKLVCQISLNPLVAHESNIYRDKLYIVGGSDGNILIDSMTILGKNIQYEKGIVGIGAVSFVTDIGLLFYGGINAESHSFNGFALFGDVT
jgi:hypothetical protein